MTHNGSCHCGNIVVRYETEIPPERTEVRLCQCSFCRRHGGRTASDRAGHVYLEARDPALLTRYSFGLGTAEFWLCGRCGVYVAAVLHADGAAWAVVNVNSLDDRDRYDAGIPLSYDAEDASARIARRKLRWTPATVV